MISQFIDAMHDWGITPRNTADIVPTETSRLIADDKNRKTIYYNLSVQDDRAWGRWYCCRRGEGGAWYSRAARSWSAAEKQAWREKRAEDERLAIAARETLNARAAKECKDLYRGLAKCAHHPYLDRKGVRPAGALRISPTGDLIVPAITSDGAISTLQTITADGFKQFHYGGRKQSSFFPISLSPAHTGYIYITEGLATGLSVHMAMGAPVVVAFDAGNLVHVAKAIRDAWPTCPIIICADNDEKAPGIITRDTNPGLWYAQQAAVRVDGWTCAPDQPGMDWNDAHSTYGLDYVRDRISAARLLLTADTTTEAVVASPQDVQTLPSVVDHHSPASDEIVETYGDYDAVYEIPEIDTPHKVPTRADGNPRWFNDMVWTKEPNRMLASMGEIAQFHDGKSLANTVTFIRNHYHGLFVLNEFSDEIIVRVCPPWSSDDHFRVHTLTDADINEMTCTLEYYGFSPSTERTFTAIKTVAVRDRIHPARNYLASLKWDGKPRLYAWLRTYLGATGQPDAYTSAIGTKWLVAAVRRVFEPGCKFDHMLVLEGPQGRGKSTALRILATIAGEEYFTDGLSMADLGKPAALQILQGKLIVEFAELDGMNAATNEHLKRWITVQADEMVKKWEKTVTKYPRQFVLAGTTNDDRWLRDVTGNRRYWPVAIGNIDTDALRKDCVQLWAEAYHLYRDGYQVWIDPQDEVNVLAMAEQSARTVEDAWFRVLEAKLETANYCTYEDLYEYLGVPIKERDNTKDTRIRACMRLLQWDYRRDFAATKEKRPLWMRRK